MKLEPMYDKIVVKQDKANEKIGNTRIIAPESAKEKPRKGEVIAVGPGLLLQDGTLAEMPLSVGDKVFFTSYGGSEIEVDGEKLLFMSANDVLSIIKN